MFSFIIGVIGVTVIVIGSGLALYDYIKKRGDVHHLAHTRLVLGTHLVFGLDFLVGKDIIDTLVLPSHSFEWDSVGILACIIAIRIVLTYFLAKELKGLKKEEGEELQKS